MYLLEAYDSMNFAARGRGFSLLISRGLVNMADERAFVLPGVSWERDSGLCPVPDVGYVAGKVCLQDLSCV